jgi:thiamine-monophosphate kinase
MSDDSAEDERDRPPARDSSARRGPPAGGEFAFIERLRRREAKRIAPSRAPSSTNALHSSLRTGIGDDAAVIRQRAGLDTVVTSDLLVEGVDFDLERFPVSPRDLGHKALAVSLSDVAAMGARPRFCLLAVGLPERRWRGGFLEQFYEGVRALAVRHDVLLVGGDVSRTPERVVVDSVVIGEARAGRAVLRSGARPGDQLFVTGALGGAAAGLRLLERGLRARPTRAERRLVLRQTRPEPRVEWGLLVGERRLATSMIDLSDGLSSDLAHLCREGRVGARVEADGLPFDAGLRAAGFGDAEALSLALDGGEDFELLFTVRPRDVPKLPAEVGGVPVTRVGEIDGARARMSLVRNGRARLLRPGGFEHFRDPRR